MPPEAGFFWPLTTILRVWLVSLSPLTEYSTCWNSVPGEYPSTVATCLPSRSTSAIPWLLAVAAIHCTAVPVKVTDIESPVVSLKLSVWS